MISWINKIFGKEDKFFDLLEAGAQEAKTSVNLLASYLHTLSAGGPPANLDDFVQSRRKEKRIRHEMQTHLGEQRRILSAQRQTLDDWSRPFTPRKKKKKNPKKKKEADTHPDSIFSYFRDEEFPF